MNHFANISTAERYAKGRPFFHRGILNRIQTRLSPSKKFDHALDVACGTGLSTKALPDIANNVFATDISEEMLNYAKQILNISFQIASAEKQPFNDDSFDLITVSSGVHWFDIDLFLLECNRLLKSDKWLVLYENYFTGIMEGQSDFKKWFFDQYLQKFPSPPRNRTYSWGNENLSPKGFHFLEEDRFQNQVNLTKKQLILYFTTQSNISAYVNLNGGSYQEVESWLSKELSPFFTSENSTNALSYGNWIKYIQKSS